MKDSRAIAVVEGDDAAYEAIRSGLQAGREGCNVVRANCDELLARACESSVRGGIGRPLAMVLDETLLGRRCVQVLSELRTSGVLSCVPVVILMKEADEGRISEYQTMGASACIIRPQSEEGLKDAMARLSGFLSVVQVP